MNSDANDLAEFFNLLAERRFEYSDFKEARQFEGRQDTTFYTFRKEPEGHRYVMKKFPPVMRRAGSEALDYAGRDRFMRELTALEALKNTDRVCPVIFSSKDLPQYGRGDFAGPYFIVKREYPHLLRFGQWGQLRLLEWAAQEADISHALLLAGWRDFDGNPTNDALADGGRIIRIDLDGVHPTWASAEKFNDMYHTPHHARLRSLMKTSHAELTQEEAEIDSLAIRISRLLLNEQAEFWALADRILALKHQRRFNSLRRSGPARAVYDREGRYREAWTRLWHARTVYKDPSPGFLLEAEATFTARLFFRILTTAGHGMSLSDLYFSLMLLDLAVFKRRREELAGYGRLLEQLESIAGELYEPRRFRQPVPQPDTEGNRAEAVPLASPTSEAYELVVTAGGNAWKGRKKGTDREGDDVVILPLSEEVSVIVLADGATGAGGATAARTVKDVHKRWAQNVSLRNVLDYRRAISDLVSAIHQELLDQRTPEGKTCETTLVVMAIVNNPAAPCALLMRCGNSGYLVTHEGAAGRAGADPDYFLTSPKESTPMLGSTILDLSKVSLVPLPLNVEGVYRLRAYSDGIASNDKEARKLLDKSTGIRELVAEAEHWDTMFTEVRDDDWSVAGFDVTVKKCRFAPAESPPEAPPVLKSESALESLDLIDPAKFIFSHAAANFWHDALNNKDLEVLKGYPLIGEVLARYPKPAKVVTQKQIGRTGRLGRRFYVTTAAIFLIIVAAVGLKVYLGRVPPPQRQVINAMPTPTPNPPPPRPPRLSNDAAEIYRELISKGGIILGDQPAGADITKDPLKSDLISLKEILDSTSLRLRIEVHTDLTGSGSADKVKEDNQRTSELRADKISKALGCEEGTAAGRCRAVGRGQEIPIILGRSEEANKKNRRLVVTRE
jgi:hypothetical protein